MRVLVADDDTVNRTFVELALKKAGYDVVAVADGEQAIAAMWEHFPIVITDWMMPGVDGLELCRRIRARRIDKYTYVIVLTALEGKGRYLEAMEAGADDVLTKPFDAELLAARLRVAARVLGLRREVQQLESLLPICAWCKSIRQDDGSWDTIETHLKRRGEVPLSHGVCPSCYEKHLKPQMT
jgi:DNA-binding response OmpR family regulator